MSVCKEHCTEVGSGTNTMQMAPIYSSGYDACWVMCHAPHLHHGAWCLNLPLLSLSCEGTKAFLNANYCLSLLKTHFTFHFMLCPTHRQFSSEPHSTFQIDTDSVPGDSAEIERKARTQYH